RFVKIPVFGSTEIHTRLLAWEICHEMRCCNCFSGERIEWGLLSCCRDCLASRDCKGLMQSMKYKTMYCLPISESDFSFTWMDIDIDQVRIQFEEQGKCRMSFVMQHI